MAERTIKVRFLGQDVSLGSTTKSVAGDVEGLAAKTESGGKRMSGAMKGALIGAGGAVVAFGAKSVQAALDGEKSQAQLETAIRNTGGSVRQLGPVVDDMANRWAKYGYENDTVNEALAKLTTVSGSARKGMDLLQVTTDLAKGRNIDLSKSADIVGKVVNGNVGALGRLGIATKDSTGKTLTSAQALDALAKKYHGVSDEIANTPAGKLQAVQAEFANFEEQVGNQILPVLTGAFDVVKDVEGAFDSLPGPMKVVAEVGLGVAAGGYAITKSYGFVKGALGDLKGVYGDVRTLAGKLGDKFLTSADQAVTASAETNTAVTSIGTTAEASAATTTVASTEASTSISTIGDTAVETSAVVSGAAVEADGALAGIGAAAEDSAVVTGEAFGTMAGEAQDLAASIIEAKAESNAGTWGGGGFAPGPGVPTGNGGDGGGNGFVDTAERIGEGGAGAAAARLLGKGKPLDDPNAGFGKYSNAFQGFALANAYNATKFTPTQRDTAVATLMVQGSSVRDVKKQITKDSGPGASKAELTEAAALTAALLKEKGVRLEVTSGLLTNVGALARNTVATWSNTTAGEKNVDTTNAMAKSLGDYGKTLHATTDPVFAAVHANDQLQESKLAVMQATNDVAQAESEHGKNSQEYRAAVLALDQAQQGQVESALNQQSALAGLQAGFADGTVSADKMRATLASWVAQGLITQGEADQQIAKMGLLKAKAGEIDGTNVRIGATFDDANARAKMDAFVGKAAGVAANIVTSVGAGLAASLGFHASKPKKGQALGGRNGPGHGVTLVGEDGPELVVFDKPGTVIPAGRTAQILAADADARGRLGIEGFADGGRPPSHREVIVGEHGLEFARFDEPATIYPNGTTPPAPAAQPQAASAVAVAMPSARGGPIEVTIPMAAGAIVVHVDRDMSDAAAEALVAGALQRWVRTNGGWRLRELVNS